MRARLLCYADLHIFDRSGLELALAGLRQAVRAHRPDAVVCLGDIFSHQEVLEEFGPAFRAGAESLHPRCIFLAGNHDGSRTDKGRNELGWDCFCSIFGPVQQVHVLNGLRLLAIGDCFAESGWPAFLEREARPGDILLRHTPAEGDELERLAGRGMRLVLAGHRHALRRAWSRDGRCQQITHAPFLFGGRSGDPAGCSIIDLIDNEVVFRWSAQAMPAMPGNHRIAPAPVPAHLTLPASAGLGNAATGWAESAPLVIDGRSWVGGIGRLQHRVGSDLRWERRYAASYQDVCSPALFTHSGREHLVVGGTWVGATSGSGFASVLVADPTTGEERYRIPIVGVTAAPACADGILYLVGQWREIVAVELATGRELWRNRSETAATATGMSWLDGRTGGGWSVCQAAIGRHVWTVNARGDLFAYDLRSGREAFVHPLAIPLNAQPCCPFANRLACIAEGFDRLIDVSGRSIFAVNGQGVVDETGELIDPPGNTPTWSLTT